MIRIGIVGCGAIGTELARVIDRRFRKQSVLIGLCDIDKERASKLSKGLRSKPPLLDLEGLIKKSELVIEAASSKVSANIVRLAINSKKDIMVMSSGGLIGNKNLFKMAESISRQMYLPSGAICGLDGLRAARIGRTSKVVLITRKPIKGLKDAPYFRKYNIDLTKLKEEKMLFKGSAKEAIKLFPQNVNVAATLSIFGIGPKRTEVQVWTSPGYKRNTHEVIIEGDFGRIFTRTENIPSKQNPKTSQLAIYSAIAKLEEILGGKGVKN